MQEYDTSVHRIELKLLINLTKSAKNLLQVSYSKDSEKDLPFIFHHEFNPTKKNRDRIINDFFGRKLQKLLKYLYNNYSY